MTTQTNVLIRPIVTEKTVAQKGKYTFAVNPKASKKAIEKAIQEFYGVEIEKVNITKLPQKNRMTGKGRSMRKRAALTKAVVTTKNGTSIDFNAFK